MTMLRVRDLAIRFGGVVALDGVSLDLNRGEILGLIGPNGAGKTTLFNCISGVVAPDMGTLVFENRSLRGVSPHERARRGIARTFQNLQLWGSMTVAENLAVPIDALGRRNTLGDAVGAPLSVFAERVALERVGAILHSLDLGQFADTLAGDLPAGIQRRIEIARALSMRPKLLLLDEPAAGLDAQETTRLVEMLRNVRDRFHVSMLLVDHDMELVMRVCDFVYVLDFGKLLARGRPAEIRKDPKVISAYLGEEHPDLASDEVAVTINAVEPRSERVPPESGPLLEVSQLAAGYGHLEVIRNVNLVVHQAEVVACIGANGAGKTTTLRAISGVVRPHSGRVVFDGHDVTGRRPEWIARLGLAHIPEGRGLFPRLSVDDTLKLAADSAPGGAGTAAAYEAFPRLAQRRRQAVGTLSGGEQQMVAMARALIARPRLLMVDEMSQGLAPTIVRQLFEMLEVLRRQGTAVLLVEQFVESALDVADRAYVFEHGTVGPEWTAAELKRDRKLVTRSYLGSSAEAPASGRAANDAGRRVHPDLLEVLAIKVPANVKRGLEDRAEREGRTAGSIAIELLEGSKPGGGR
ncbi:MAG TPA: ATP-binding cassette domain-containing protein [Candidatus Dormibacteraeota bacterium]|jgi:branched-chain amino acid transport system ATP-binding protein